ncbi:nuclear transport factor 2 family protein [Maribacter antarcticus]|uniref:nuclear transport factor 2 family protein n=1 Tax=Maribacter antarcticus TaxID=505250 RepID=UPI0012EC3E6E|nr:nuclear transport factor 2 family protein [Maribacter antarcticus]
MKKIQLFLSLVLMLSVASTYANTPAGTMVGNMETQNDSVRLAALDAFWAEVSRTVHEGDFEGYKATYHEDAVVVFTTGENKASISITKALANWKQDFIDTKAGRTQNSVIFRFSQRIGDETTAHETGIFTFQSNDGSAKENPRQFIHFEALLIKRDNSWLMVMEYQKSKASEEEWELLE